MAAKVLRFSQETVRLGGIATLMLQEQQKRILDAINQVADKAIRNGDTKALAACQEIRRLFIAG